jgi:hypothetical protein
LSCLLYARTLCGSHVRVVVVVVVVAIGFCR